MLKVTKEPQTARYTSDKAMIKDHFYYKGNDFSWNKPARTNEKYYPYYHKQQDEKKDKIVQMKQKEIEDVQLQEASRRVKLIEKKAIDKVILDSRVKERESIQRVSNQPVSSQTCLDTSDDDVKLVGEIVCKRHNVGKNLRSEEFSWNMLNQASKKNVDIYLGSFTVKREEEMLKWLKLKAEEEKLEEEERKKKNSEVHKKLRDMFLSRQEENITREQMVSRPSTAKTSFFHAKKNQISNDNVPGLNLKEGLKNREFSANSLNVKLKDGLSSPKSIEKGSYPSITPRGEKYSRKEIDIDHSDYQGMLVKNMDDKLFYNGNNFYDALVAQSKVFQQVLEENKNNRRPNSSRKTLGSGPQSAVSKITISTRPATSRQKNFTSMSPTKPLKIITSIQRVLESEPYSPTKDKPCIEEEKAMGYDTAKDMKNFEMLFPKSGKSGYSRIDLEEAYRLSNSKGLTYAKKINEKKQQPLVK